MILENLGWDPYFETNFRSYLDQGYTAGRVAAQYKNAYRLYTEHGELTGEVSGNMRYKAAGYNDFPAIGDWVIISARPHEKKATIHGFLPRKSKFSRKMAGQLTEEQIVAANVDTVFLVTSLNNNFNLRRIERYLITAWESGANPVIILSKADICDDIEDMVRSVEAIAPGVPIHVISSVMMQGLDVLKQYLGEGQTVALIGSSGVGKSTLVNELSGSKTQEVREVREHDDHGMHTTTYRELIILPAGGLIIDTPGMRELQLWDVSEGMSETFEDIEAFASQCRFGDCRHEKEPFCAVKQAEKDGIIPKGRLDSYKKLQKELRYLESKQNHAEKINEKKNMQSTSKALNARKPISFLELDI